MIQREEEIKRRMAEINGLDLNTTQEAILNLNKTVLLDEYIVAEDLNGLDDEADEHGN